MASRKLELEIRKLEKKSRDLFQQDTENEIPHDHTILPLFSYVDENTFIFPDILFFLCTRFPVPQATSCARLLRRAPLHASGENGHFDSNGIYHYGQTDPVEMGAKPINETAKMLRLGNQGGRIGYTGK